MSTSPIPLTIKLLHKSHTVEIAFDDGKKFILPFEYLRVQTPSAEARGHGLGERKIVAGKENVKITAIEPVGNYAVRFIFDDGHQSGLYTWEYLYELGLGNER